MQESENITRLRSGFEDYYNNVLQPEFAGMEETRKKYLRYFIFGLLIVFIVIPLICFALFWLFLQQNGGNFHYEGELPVGLILFGLMCIIAIVSTPLTLFKKHSKGNVMPEFIKYFGDFSYHYQQYLDDFTLRKSKLFKDYNRHSGDDFFNGEYRGVGIAVSEEDLKYHTYNGKRSSTSTVFKGIVILLEMNKNFSGQTIVLKDWGIFNAFHKLGNLKTKLQRIVLEDSVFEKQFEVYGTDQLEARYLLTTAFMERMLKVRDAYKSNKIQFSFFDNKLLIAINTNKNMFESTSIFRSTTDRKLIDQTFEQIVSIMAVIDILKLDRRTGM